MEVLDLPDGEAPEPLLDLLLEEEGQPQAERELPQDSAELEGVNSTYNLLLS